MSEAVEIFPYDPAWPAEFERERASVARILGENARLIEHMGSTAVPGLPAKPVIDVIVLVDDLAAARSGVPALEATGYSFWADNPDKSKLFLVRGLPPAQRRTHHLHIYTDADEVRRHLVFRDFLRANPDAAAAYLALKQDLAARHRDDREAYTSGKQSFIDALVAGAAPVRVTPR